LRSILSINLLEALVVFCITLVSFYVTLTVTPRSTIDITPNSTPKKIITHLTKQGYALNPIDAFLLSSIGTLKQGEVRLKQKPITKLDFLYQLTQAKTPLFKVTLIPGETTTLFLEEVSDILEINATKLQNAYNIYAPFPEASIVAETYLLPKKMNEVKCIKFLLKESHQVYHKLATKYFGEYNEKEWLRVLIIASIIQKEAANNKEMPLVSSVIYNRLKKGMRLQMDGTLNYGQYSHRKVTPQQIKEDESPFNTYKHKGLPPSPIGAVSDHAIDAAIHPAQTDYLFFMKNNQGTHDFTKTFRAHRKNVKKAQSRP
jgi:UPF0755 protein